MLLFAALFLLQTQPGAGSPAAPQGARTIDPVRDWLVSEGDLVRKDPPIWRQVYLLYRQTGGTATYDDWKRARVFDGSTAKPPRRAHRVCVTVADPTVRDDRDRRRRVMPRIGPRACKRRAGA